MKKLFLIAWGAEPGVVELLAPLPNVNQTAPQTQVGSLTEYLSFIFPLAIGLAATLAILMIVIGGVQIIFSGGSAGKVADGKRRITEAIWGLILALAAYLILYTINPDLISLKFIL